MRVLVGSVGPFELGIDLEKPTDNRPSQALLDQAANPSNDHSELSDVPISPKNQFVAAGTGATRVVIHPMLSQACEQAADCRYGCDREFLGKVIRKVLPTDGVLSAAMSPPMS